MDEASSGGTPGREHSGIAARLSAEAEEPSDVVEMKGFNRTLAEIEWLLLVLILVYMTLPDEKVQHPLHILGAGGLFALFVVGFRYANLLALPSRWKFTIETWAMIALTAVAVWNTGKVDSPLLNLFLLVVIFSAITLGRLVTLLELCLIASFYLLSAYAMEGVDMFRYEIFSYLMLNFAPFVLVAYVTSLLAADLGAARAHAEQLAGTDELTGLSNIRAFKNALSRYERAAHKGNEPLSILMIDIDKLKRVNDQYGHEIGNAVIRTVATAIRQSVRAEDFVARVLDRRLQVADLAAAVVAFTGEGVGDDGFLCQQRRDGVGELNLAAGAGLGLFQLLEDRRRQQVAADDGEVGRGILRFRLLDDGDHPQGAVRLLLGLDDAVLVGFVGGTSCTLSTLAPVRS
jgi:hypothetical protein